MLWIISRPRIEIANYLDELIINKLSQVKWFEAFDQINFKGALSGLSGPNSKAV